MLPENTYTIEQLIQAEKVITLEYGTFSFINTLKNGTTVATFNVLTDYIEDLITISRVVELSDKEYHRYKFKPKLLCKEVYGNGELYFIILLINNIADVKEFDRKRFRMLAKEDMDILMSQIYNAEYKAVKYYNDKQ